MKSLIALVFVLAIATLVIAALKGKTQGASEKPRRKRPLTDREQAMFNRLRQSLPDLHVMPQVAFSALLTAKTRAARNTFDRKVADFVICDAAFQVRAVVELDDSSHNGREHQDAQRDRKLTDAGYRVIRYSQVPDIAKVQADFAPQEVSTTPSPEVVRSAQHVPQRRRPASPQ